MDKKLEYQSPEIDLIHLSTESPLLDGSVDANGADVTWYGDESSFDSLFN